MRGFQFTAQTVYAHQAGFLVDAQHLPDLRRAVTEHGQEGSYALRQQAQHQEFRYGRVDVARERAGFARGLDASCGRNRGRTRDARGVPLIVNVRTRSFSAHGFTLRMMPLSCWRASSENWLCAS